MQWYACITLPFLLSMLFTPIIRIIGIYLNAYAQVNERTIHVEKTTRIGGVAIFLSFLISMTLVVVRYGNGIDITMQALLIAGFIVFIGGLIDDLFTLPPFAKFAFQLVATYLLVHMGGVELGVIHLPFGIVINMGLVSILVTYLWVIGVCNAINLIDGLDGLAAGVCIIILLTIAACSFIDGRYLDVGMLSLLLAGACLGFLLFNIHPASIFMGDSGSLFLGFVIAAISLMGFKSSTFITLGFPILLLAVPLIDTLSAVLRRLLKRQRITLGDKNHLHHVLMRKYGHRNTVFIIYGITICFGVSAYLYIYDKIWGLCAICILFVGMEFFIEKTGLISERYRPILYIVNVLKKDKKTQKRD